MVTGIDTGEFFSAIIIGSFDFTIKLVDALDMLVASDNVFKVFQQSSLVFVLGLGLHEGDLLHFTL